ncbi:MAG: IS5 family transposase [Bacteroidota bacterium]
MLAKPKNTAQSSLFSTLSDQLDSKHPLYLLANVIQWQLFEDVFSKYYSSTMGKPAKPIRLMVSLLILKQLRNLSDENIVLTWSENLYFQYFSGEQNFVPRLPCSSTELVEFRKRIGTDGVELILKESIRVNGKDGDEGTLSADTTVQEKNITYPTDTKLHKKIITKCIGIAKAEKIVLRQSYKFTVKTLETLLRFQHTKNGSRAARKARKKIKTIAGRLVRDITRKLSESRIEVHKEQLGIYEKVLHQKRSESNKIYSLHEPDVKCYTKGKAHKKYEFGSKASILVTQTSGVIVGALSFNETLHDSKTLPKVIEQYERINNKKPNEIYVDRGYRGPKEVNEVNIYVPQTKKEITKAQRKKHSRRAAIEPVIGHLKQDYRLQRNFLKGNVGDAINLMLSAAAMNFKRVMNLWLTEANCRWKFIYMLLINIYRLFLPKYQKMTF